MSLEMSSKNDIFIEAQIARDLSNLLKYYLRKKNFSEDEAQRRLGNSILAYCPVGGKQDAFGEWIWNLYSQLDYMGDYSCDPKKYESTIIEAIKKLDDYIYDDISYFKYKDTTNSLNKLISNIESALNKDFLKKENRFFYSSQLWAFLSEIDKEKYPEFFNFMDQKAEELDQEPLPLNHSNYKNEIDEYKDKVEYILGYLKRYSQHQINNKND